MSRGTLDSSLVEPPKREPEKGPAQPALDALKMPFESRIDVHAHFIPPFYRTACEAAGKGAPDGMPQIPVRCPGAQPQCVA
jgi:hypothetical protein